MPINKAIRDVAKQIKHGELGRAVAHPEAGTPGDDTSGYHTDIYNYFTPIGGSNLIYSSQGWVKIKLTLETAGPVAVSTRQDITPALSGKGRLLPVGEEVEFYLGKGDRLFVTATAVNRVSVVVEPVPWLQAIAIAIGNANGILGKILGNLRLQGGGGPSYIPPGPPTQAQSPAPTMAPKLRTARRIPRSLKK